MKPEAEPDTYKIKKIFYLDMIEQTEKIEETLTTFL
jgi:hypothetical protein